MGASLYKTATTAVLVAAAVGLLTFFAEDAISSTIQRYKWILPLLTGFATLGAFAFMTEF